MAVDALSTAPGTASSATSGTVVSTPVYEGPFDMLLQLILREQVDIYDITNGVRFTTYVIYGSTGQIQINGAAANIVDVGDRVIIAAYTALLPEEIAAHRVKVVQVDDHNHATAIQEAGVGEP